MNNAPFDFNPKQSHLNFGNLNAKRSQSSFSNISTKTLMRKSNSKELTRNPSEACLEVTQMSKNKHDLEEKVISAMQEMKNLKLVSKNLRNKELEMEMLQENLNKAEEEICEIRSRFDKSEQLLYNILKNCINCEDEPLMNLYQSTKHPQFKLKQKRNSLIIDDLEYKPDLNKGNVKTTREQKHRSPYFSQSSLQILTTPKLKKFSFYRGNISTNKSSPKIEKKKYPINDKLQNTFDRVKRILEDLSKRNKLK